MQFVLLPATKYCVTQDPSAARWFTEQLQQLILTISALLFEERAYALQLWNAAAWLLMTRCAAHM